jgi:hypothetical protein
MTIKYRKQFGRWGECAVARAFRDRNFHIQTQDGLARIPFRDLTISKGGVSVDVQVKATNRRRPADVFQIDWTMLSDYLSTAEARGAKFALAVVNLQRRSIYIYTMEVMQVAKERAEQAIGDHYSQPGRVELDYETDPAKIWPLTIAEIESGTRIAEDQSDRGSAKLDLEDLFGE